MIKEIDLNELAKELKNAYDRNWRSKNKDKVKIYNARYWQRKALRLKIDKGA